MLHRKRRKRINGIRCLRRRHGQLYGVLDEKSSSLSRFLRKIRQNLAVCLDFQHKSTPQDSQTYQFTSGYAKKLHIDAHRHLLTLVDGVFARRFTVTVTSEMADRLEEERKRRLLDSIPETIRLILSERLSSC
jgi:hypothetical protein